jgi:dihydrodipicolinate synthase/N-acetylneuraminate lyase
MMPAWSTADAGSLTAVDTVDTDSLRDGLDRVIKDGVGIIATTGTFGQTWNLFYEEFQTLVKASIEAVNGRVPLMLGVTSANPRDVVRRMRFVRDVGGKGVLLGLPHYEPLPVADIHRFYGEIAEMFPDIDIMIYHNPVNHHVHIPVYVFQDLVKLPNIVAMKDSHRSVLEFQKLHSVIHGKIAHFVNQTQLYPYYEMGASGCWSHHIWAGIWPVLALLQAVEDGDVEAAKAVTADLSPGLGGGGEEDPRARRGHLFYEYAGYVNIGPPRAPHAFGLRDPQEAAANEEKAKKAAARWVSLCEKYRDRVEARRKVAREVSSCPTIRLTSSTESAG